MKCIKKPVIAEAHQLTEKSRREIARWLNNGREGDSEPKDNLVAWFYSSNGDDELYVDTTEGSMVASDGDWIIRNEIGEVYIYQPDAFEATYEQIT